MGFPGIDTVEVARAYIDGSTDLITPEEGTYTNRFNSALRFRNGEFYPAEAEPVYELFRTSSESYLKWTWDYYAGHSTLKCVCGLGDLTNTGDSGESAHKYETAPVFASAIDSTTAIAAFRTTCSCALPMTASVAARACSATGISSNR